MPGPPSADRPPCRYPILTAAQEVPAVAETAVDRRQPRHHRARCWWAGRWRPATGAASTAATRPPASRAGATHVTPTCAGSPGSTTTPSPSTATTAAAARSAPSTGPPVTAGPPAAATPTRTCGCPPTAPPCCRRAAPGWSCGARTWSGCWSTARSTPGSSRRTAACIRLHAGVRGGQLVGGVGAGGVREAGRHAARAAAPGQGRRRTPATPGGRTRDPGGFRRAGAGGVGDQHRRVPADTAAAGRRHRRDRHHGGQHAAAQTAVDARRWRPRPGSLVTWWTGDALVVFDRRA